MQVPDLISDEDFNATEYHPADYMEHVTYPITQPWAFPENFTALVVTAGVPSIIAPPTPPNQCPLDDRDLDYSWLPDHTRQRLGLMPSPSPPPSHMQPTIDINEPLPLVDGDAVMDETVVPPSLPVLSHSRTPVMSQIHNLEVGDYSGVRKRRAHDTLSEDEGMDILCGKRRRLNEDLIVACRTSAVSDCTHDRPLRIIPPTPNQLLRDHFHRERQRKEKRKVYTLKSGRTKGIGPRPKGSTYYLVPVSPPPPTLPMRRGSSSRPHQSTGSPSPSFNTTRDDSVGDMSDSDGSTIAMVTGTPESPSCI